MGFSGSKISGHSGTEFKHRKAFYKKLKPMVTGTTNTPGKDIYPEYSYRELQKARAELRRTNYRKYLLICIPTVILLIIFMGYINSQFLANLLGHSPTIETQIQETSIETYHLFVEAGFVALKENRLHDAQLDFMQAIETNHYGKEANLGLTKTLAEACRQRGKFCEKAALYFDFTKSLSDVSEVDLRQLGVDAFFE